MWSRRRQRRGQLPAHLIAPNLIQRWSSRVGDTRAVASRDRRPGAPAALADLAESLHEVLGRSQTGDVSIRCSRICVDEQAEIAQVTDSADPASHDQDVVGYLTYLPRRDGTRPVMRRSAFSTVSAPLVA
jgi:hypothetical protein